MDVFIGNLSPRTTQNDIATLFKSFLTHGRIQIHEKRYEDGATTRYAIVSIEPDKLAEKAIKKLSGQRLNGVPAVLREFYHRSYGNERRAIGWRDRSWNGEERRQQERRRTSEMRPASLEQAGANNGAEQGMTIDLDHVQVEARANYVRKY